MATPFAHDVRYQYRGVGLEYTGNPGAAFVNAYLRTRLPLLEAQKKAAEKSLKTMSDDDLAKFIADLERNRTELAGRQMNLSGISKQASVKGYAEAARFAASEMSTRAKVAIANAREAGLNYRQGNKMSYDIAVSKALSDVELKTADAAADAAAATYKQTLETTGDVKAAAEAGAQVLARSLTIDGKNAFHDNTLIEQSSRAYKSKIQAQNLGTADAIRAVNNAVTSALYDPHHVPYLVDQRTGEPSVQAALDQADNLSVYSEIPEQPGGAGVRPSAIAGMAPAVGSAGGPGTEPVVSPGAPQSASPEQPAQQGGTAFRAGDWVLPTGVVVGGDPGVDQIAGIAGYATAGDEAVLKAARDEFARRLKGVRSTVDPNDVGYDIWRHQTSHPDQPVYDSLADWEKANPEAAAANAKAVMDWLATKTAGATAPPTAEHTSKAKAFDGQWADLEAEAVKTKMVGQPQTADAARLLATKQQAELALLPEEDRNKTLSAMANAERIGTHAAREYGPGQSEPGLPDAAEVQAASRRASKGLVDTSADRLSRFVPRANQPEAASGPPMPPSTPSSPPTLRPTETSPAASWDVPPGSMSAPEPAAPPPWDPVRREEVYQERVKTVGKDAADAAIKKWEAAMTAKAKGATNAP